MKRIWLVLGAVSALALAGCHRTPPDPLAADRAACANEALTPSAQVEACKRITEAPEASAADRAGALANSGGAHARAGDTSAALHDFAASLALDDDNTGALAGRARILIASGQLDAAEPLVEKLIASGAIDARGHFMQGQIAAARADYAAAVTAFDAALAERPHDAEALAYRARMKEAQGDADGAMADLDDAIAADGASVEAHVARCWLWVRTHHQIGGNEEARAQADARTALERAPRHFEALTCLGILQLRANAWNDAKSSFDAAIALQPGDPLALFGRGVARRRGGDSAGLTDMNQARDFDRHIGETFDHLGVATY